MHKIIRQEKEKEVAQELTSDSFNAYKEEYKRLEALRDETENIWEDRTYQISVGGLSLTFAVFSYLMSGYDGIEFQWPMAVIWGVYAIGLLINYLSQHISKYYCLKHQESQAFEMLEKDKRQMRQIAKGHFQTAFVSNLIKRLTVMITQDKAPTISNEALYALLITCFPECTQDCEEKTVIQRRVSNAVAALRA